MSTKKTSAADLRAHFERNTAKEEEPAKTNKMKTTCTALSLLLLLPSAAVATNPFVTLGLNEDFARLDRHAHDAKMRRIAAHRNANSNPILPAEADSTSASVQMVQNSAAGGRPHIVNAIANAVEDCDPDMLFQREKSRHHQGDAKLV